MGKNSKPTGQTVPVEEKTKTEVSEVMETKPVPEVDMNKEAEELKQEIPDENTGESSDAETRTDPSHTTTTDPEESREENSHTKGNASESSEAETRTDPGNTTTTDPEESPEENSHDHEDAGELQAKANELMQREGVKLIWRCPDKGYWFTKKDLAYEYAKENDVTLDKYER